MGREHQHLKIPARGLRSIPNDLDEKKAQTVAKSKLSGCALSWSQQNAMNRDSCKEKLEKGLWYRNSETVPELSRALENLQALGGGWTRCSLLAAGNIGLVIYMLHGYCQSYFQVFEVVYFHRFARFV